MRKTIAATLGAVIALTSLPVLADDWRDGRRGDARWYDSGHGNAKHGQAKHGGKHDKQAGKHHRGNSRAVVVWHGKRHWNAPPRRVVYYDVHRPKHHHGSYYRRDREDWAVYAILALQLVEVLNTQQQQSYAWATHQAAAAPLGESIQWQDSGAYGSVTPVRDGTDGGGRYCREFQHQITVGNRLQEGYGTACRQPDGDWEIVS
jgi:17 kDa outer membrane surface antigen